MAAHKRNRKADDEVDTSRSVVYRPEYAPQARKLCGLGFTERWLASFFDVDEDTLDHWKRSHPEFGSAVEAGKSAVEEAAEAAAVKRILGCTRLAKKVVKGKIIEFEEYLPPDASAAIKWLSARNPEKWGNV